jgi:predicted Na+-dependent transporter
MKVIIDSGVLCVLVVMMVAVGMDLEGQHFREVSRRKWVVAATLVCQSLVLPALVDVGCSTYRG